MVQTPAEPPLNPRCAYRRMGAQVTACGASILQMLDKLYR